MFKEKNFTWKKFFRKYSQVKAGFYILFTAHIFLLISFTLNIYLKNYREVSFLSLVSLGLGGSLLIGIAYLLFLKKFYAFLPWVRSLFPFRLCIYCAFSSLIWNSYGQNNSSINDLITYYLLFLFLSIVVFSLLPQIRQSSFWKMGDLLLINLILTAVFCEIILVQYAKHSYSPFLWDPSSVESTLRIYRQPPGHSHYGFYLNSQGYYDSEFFPSSTSDYVITLLGDSFAYGIVPYKFNFVTVAEKKLQENRPKNFSRVAIHNFGIPAIGMPEYVYLLEKEVLAYSPNLVVLCVFVGNDFVLNSPKLVHRDFSNWWIYRLPKRLSISYQQKKKNSNQVQVAISPPRTHNGSQEHPTFTREKFLEIENDRLVFCQINNPAVENNYRGFFKVLDHIHWLAKERLLLVILPDEYQVNDQLYQTLLEKKQASDYYREYPQKKIKEYCLENKLPFLDLLPALRKAEKEGRTYHLQDTHFNSRGNRVVGEQIAQYIQKKYFSSLKE